MKNLHVLLVRALCHYRCIFCQGGSAKHVADRERELPAVDPAEEWARVERTLRAGAPEAAGTALHFMGNDPVFHTDIVRAVALGRQLGYAKIVIETNALRLDDAAFCAELVAAGATSFKIPVYGSRAEIHDAIVRLPGAFDRVMTALAHLWPYGLEVELSALILQQNAHDLPRCRFPYPIGFRFPFRHEDADFPYDYFAPRLFDVPAFVLFRSDILIPCITGRRVAVRLQEERVSPGRPDQPRTDRHTVRRRPFKCHAGSCPDYHHCQGIYLAYLETYGEEEFEPRPHMAQLLLEHCCRLTNRFDGRPRAVAPLQDEGRGGQPGAPTTPRR